MIAFSLNQAPAPYPTNLLDQPTEEDMRRSRSPVLQLNSPKRVARSAALAGNQKEHSPTVEWKDTLIRRVKRLAPNQ